MELETGVLGKPALHVGVPMSSVVVQDEMDVLTLGNFAIDRWQEAEELPVAVTGVALADHLARQHVERREQGGGSVAFVVMGHGAGTPTFDGEPGLGPIESLDLTPRAPRGAMGTERPEMVAIGLSRQADEAEGSLTLGTQERAGAALTTRGRAETSGPPGPSKRDREVDERNQRFKAPSRSAGSNPEDMGRNATHARARATPKPFEDNGEEATGKDCGVPVAMSQGQSWPPILSIGPW